MQPYRVELLIKHGRPLDGVDLDDRDKLYEQMQDFDQFKDLTIERLEA